MRKVLILLFVIIASHSNAQPSVFILTGLSQPLGKFNNLVDLGAGFTTGVNYQINRSAIGVIYMYQAFRYMYTDAFQVNAYMVRYRFEISRTRHIRTFSGFDTGIYTERYKPLPYTRSVETNSGIQPFGGIDLFFDKQFAIETSANFSYIFGSQFDKFRHIGINIGFFISLE